jgi:uncharacterized membrane protein YkvA (DUF1232 family)
LAAGRAASESKTMSEIKYGEILGPNELVRQERRVRSGFWRTVRRAARAVPFIDEVIAAYYCAFDRKTPTRVRVILIGALAYFVLPFDSIPDIVAGLGFTDDVTVLLAALSAVRGHIGPEHRAAARRALDEA